jgi:hypothetical protein
VGRVLVGRAVPRQERHRPALHVTDDDGRARGAVRRVHLAPCGRPRAGRRAPNRRAHRSPRRRLPRLLLLGPGGRP